MFQRNQSTLTAGQIQSAANWAEQYERDRSQGTSVLDYDPERNAIETGSVGVPIMSMNGFQMPGMGDFRGGDVNVSNPDQKSMLLIALLAFIVLIIKLK